MRFRHLTCIAAAAVAVTAAVPASASAGAVTADARGANLGNPLSSTQSNMLAACTAQATSDAVETRVDECYLIATDGWRVDAPRAEAPGSFAATAQVFTDVLMRPGIRICARGSADFADGSTATSTLFCRNGLF